MRCGILRAFAMVRRLRIGQMVKVMMVCEGI
jgi:hypothetical protein